MSLSDEPVSVVEDLNPEPEQPPGRFQLRELVLGLLLLVGVLGFAGWQWWSQEARQSSYANAVDALSRNDLDQARSLFAGASGYRDADSRARDLDQRIALRDSLYISATDQISVGNWAVALAVLRALRGVQPDFRDSAELERSVVRHLAGDLLDNSVALRTGPGITPGLYYRRDFGWVYLPESDLSSRIRGSGASGFLVYDVPAPDVDPKARRLMLANFNSSSPPSGPLPFDPAVYQDFRWNESGVWAFRYGRYSTPGRAPVVNALHGVEAEFLPYGSVSTYKVSFENTGGATGAVLADLDGTSERYLVASWAGAQQMTSGILSSTVLSLSLGSAGGASRTIFSASGVGIDSARLSRDGHYALVTTFTPSSAYGLYRLFLVDLQNGGEPRQIDTVRTRPGDGDSAPVRWIASTFIESGAYAGDVLTAVLNYDHTHLRVFDPGMLEEPVVDVEVPTSSGLAWAVSRSDERGLVVSGALSSYPPRYAEVDRQTVPVVEISASGQTTQTTVLVSRYGYPYTVDLTGDQLAVVCVQTEEDKYVWTVYTAPPTSLGHSLVRASVMYTQYVPGAVGVAGPAPVSGENGLLTYLVNDSLRVRTYDGAVDIPLDEGIRALYSRRLLHERYPVLR